MAAADPKVTPGEEVEYDSPPIWLKVLVIVLGIAIVGMLVAIVTKIIAGIEEQPLKEAAEKQAHVSATAPLITGDMMVKRPEGTELVATTLSGNHLLLTFRGEDGDHILILDPAAGTESWVRIPK